MPVAKSPIEELDFEEYQKRQYFETTFEGIESRMEKVAIGGRSKWISNQWEPQPYPGFAMQAMVEASMDKTSLFIDLAQIQTQLVELIERPGALYPMPKASFHQTVANTFSAERLQRNIIDKGLLEEYPEIIAGALDDLPERDEPEPPCMLLIGVAVFRTAFGLLGIFSSERDFNRIIDFRDQFYKHPTLSRIGIERTRPFIGHVTLGYFEDILTQEEKNQFATGLAKINEEIAQYPLRFYLPKAELHRYETLSEFIPDPSYPAFKL